MTYSPPILFFLLSLPFLAMAQDSREREIDSQQKQLDKEHITIDGRVEKRREINPLAPGRAAFYSAVLPGLGQIYNKRYWKVPIVYGALGAGLYVYNWNDDNYDRFRTALKRRRAGFTDDEFYDRDGNNQPGDPPDFDLDVLENQQERFQRDRDLALVITIALYALNIVDANVDAHLQQFNVNDDLSMDLHPYWDLDCITGLPQYGLACTIKF